MMSRRELSALADALGGLPVLGCLEGSPAALAGARYGDILLAVNDVPTPTWDDFIEARKGCEGHFRARIFRDGNELELTIGLRPAGKTPFELLGELVGMGLGGHDPDPAGSTAPN